ncbi:hypothetical protein BCON_0347g00090 [Botryotinia convoluta]|uniref:Uncharacterized protein n=1 Tax=Botryotinia convoluta TaxID=54673 RepID=A0A4Z1HB63_9HELO|nr:hypothetical protein BCON_0347g00090 [Botryotinia convoluta]
MSKNNLDNLAPGVKPALFDPRKKKVPQQPSLSQMLTQRSAVNQGPATQPPADTVMGGFFGSASGMATPQQDAQGMPPNQPAAEKNKAVSFGAGIPTFGAGMPTFGNGFGDAEPKPNPPFKFSISHMVPKSIDHATLKQENTDLRVKLEKANKELNDAKEKVGAQQSEYEKMETEFRQSKLLATESAWNKQQHESKEKDVEDLETSNAGFQLEVSRLNEVIKEAKERIATLEADLAISTQHTTILKARGIVLGYEAQPSDNEVSAKDLEISDLKGRIGGLDDDLENTKNTANAEFNRLQGIITNRENELQLMKTEKIDLEKKLQNYREDYESSQGLKMRLDSELQVALTDKTTAETLVNQHNSTILQLQSKIQDLHFKHAQEKSDAEVQFNQHIGEKQQVQQDLHQLQQEYEKVKSNAETLAKERDAAVAGAAKVVEERDAAIASAAKAVSERDAAITGDVKERHTAGFTFKQLVSEEIQGSKSIIQQLKDDLTQPRQQVQTLAAEKAQMVDTKSHQSTIEERGHRALIRKSECQGVCLQILYEAAIENATNPTSANAVTKVQQLEIEFLKSQEDVESMERTIEFDDKLSSQALRESNEKVLSLESKVLELKGSLSECTRIKDNTAIALSKYQGQAESDQEMKRTYEDKLFKKTREVEEVAAALQKLQKEHSATLKSMNQTIGSEISAHKKTSAQLHSLKEEFTKLKTELRWTKYAVKALKAASSSDDDTPPLSPFLHPVRGTSAVEQNLARKQTIKEIMDLLAPSESEEGLIAATRKAFHKEKEKIEQAIPNNEIPVTEESAEVASAEIPNILISVPESTGNSVPVQESTTVDEQIPMQMVVESPTSPTLLFAPEFVVENFLAMERLEFTEQIPIPVIVSKGKSLPRSKAYFWSKFFFIVLLTISWVGYHRYFATSSTPGIVRLTDAPRPAIIPVTTMNAPHFATRTISRLAVIPATASASVQIPQVTTVAVLPKYADYLPPILYRSGIIHLHRIKVKSVDIWDVFKTSVERFARFFSRKH